MPISLHPVLWANNRPDYFRLTREVVECECPQDNFTQPKSCAVNTSPS